MRLYEHESKRLLRRVGGLAIPESWLLSDTGEASQVPTDAYPVFTKSQVLSGGRMKAGAVGIVEHPDNLPSEIERLRATTVGGLPTAAVLVERSVAVRNEYYIGITADHPNKSAVAVFSEAGGITVNESAAVFRTPIPSLEPAQPFLFKQLLADAGVTGKMLGRLTSAFAGLAKVYATYDCVLAEVNPLALTQDGTLVALDCHIELDDEALYRQQDLVTEFGLVGRDTNTRPGTELEAKAKAIDEADHRGVAGRMIEFDGTLGLLIGGGGASLTAFDAVRSHGGAPANYCEIGGNPSVWKVKELTKLLLGKPGVERLAVIMNVVSNTRVDLIARGVVKGILELDSRPSEKIAMFRVPGAWEEDGFAILRKYGVPYADRRVSIDEAVRRAVVGER